MECFNEYYVGEIANFMRKCRFYRKTGCKMKKWKAIYFDEEWFLGIDSESSSEWHYDNIRNDDITISGMTVLQYSEWNYDNIRDDDFFWFWNIACYASGWGWRIRKKRMTAI
mgnify:FL=1